MPGASRSRSEPRRRSRPAARLREDPDRTGGRFDCHLHLSRYWPDPERNRYGPEIDFTLNGLLRELDAAGIERGLVLQLPEAPSLEASLREGAELLRESRGRLLRSVTVDPTRGVDAVRRALEAWATLSDLSAIKLYPGYRPFYPHDARLAPVYEFAARRRIVVLFHQGDTLDPRGLVKFARPIEVDEVAVRFPEVPMVICHLGNPWIDEAAELAYKNENVHLDTSGLLGPPTLPHFDRLFRSAVERLDGVIAGTGDIRKLLYGSDWPLESIATATRLIGELDLEDDERERILGGNARRLLGEGRGRG